MKVAFLKRAKLLQLKPGDILVLEGVEATEHNRDMGRKGSERVSGWVGFRVPVLIVEKTLRVLRKSKKRKKADSHRSAVMTDEQLKKRLDELGKAMAAATTDRERKRLQKELDKLMPDPESDLELWDSSVERLEGE